ncbi:MAG: hypothetical protein D6722_10360 [Bacteroidetes bacterium]|nr:MAG: hypothetical protein D6722_10360 [Bacteroidota bacterium]
MGGRGETAWSHDARLVPAIAGCESHMLWQLFLLLAEVCAFPLSRNVKIDLESNMDRMCQRNRLLRFFGKYSEELNLFLNK